MYSASFSPFSRIDASLNANLCMRQPVPFGNSNDTERKDFEELGNKIISPLILTLPKHKGKYTIDADACYKQMG